MSAKTTCLITGCNRGLGLGLLTKYLARPNMVIIATVRDPSHETALALSKLPKGEGSELIVLQMDLSGASITKAVDQITRAHGIDVLDIVISNAAQAPIMGLLSEASVDTIREQMERNAYAPFELFKVTAPLLRRSEHPRFCAISSAAASLTQMTTIVATGPYSASKAMLNHLFKWLALERDDILIWTMEPGFVDTDMATGLISGSQKLGMNDITQLKLITIDESTASIIDSVDNATMETTHGRFLGVGGVEMAL